VPVGSDAVTEAVDTDAVLAANRAFYDAFERCDLDAMSDLWEHGDDVVCVHPGWRALHGWGPVAGSWFALFGNGQPLQFIITDERAVVDGDLAWVTVEENLLADNFGSTVTALNVFRRREGRWRMVVHQGSPVARTNPG
jgi:ketosteroid isomerase-like protein